MKVIFTILLLCLLIQLHSSCRPNNKTVSMEQAAGSDSIEAKLELVTDDVAVPVEFNITPIHSQRIFITDNSGVIRIMEGDSLLPVPFLDLRVKRNVKDSTSPVGQINSVAFHPDYANNGKFYVSYSGGSTITSHSGKLIIASFTVSRANINIADPLSEQIVLQLEGKNIIANGAMIGFGPDGYLYISVGDDAIGDSNYIYRAQDLGYLNGKILRIDVNTDPYGIPADNPFVNSPTARPEIFALGLRKIWRFCFDPLTKKMVGADVGELQEEEINIVEKGGNYGWPVKEGNCEFKKIDSVIDTRFISPIHSYSHKEGLCVIGGQFYKGSDFPSLTNKYIFADFTGHLYSLAKNESDAWIRKPLKIHNKPADTFIICGVNEDAHHELYILGFLASKTGTRGVIFKLVKV